MANKLYPVASKPGIKRDGTQFEGAYYVDGQWCRFERGLPRKIGGYRAASQTLVGPIRGLFVHSENAVNRVYCGSSNEIQFIDLDASGSGGGIVSRTPATFVPSNYNLFKFAELYDGGGNTSVILVHAAPNALAIDSTQARKTWIGDAMSSAVLVDSTAPQVSGGVFTAPPYAFVYGDDGFFAWCVPNTPTDWVGAGSGNARITQSKIIHGEQVRGGSGANPAFILWSTDAVLRGTFTGGSTVFNFDTISSNSSVLSSQSIVEYDGQFFWPAIDRFLMYNGVVDEVPNNMNIDTFFSTLNWNQRQKIWGTKIARFGEIWWFYPSGNSSECNRAIIFNKRENSWYDTEISRTCGYFTQVFRWPIWADVDQSEVFHVRPLGGVPSASAGTAANAFDGDPATTCDTASPTGSITYDFGQDCSKMVEQVGIRSQTTSSYQITFEYCNDTGTVLTNWNTLFTPPVQSYPANTDVLFHLPIPTECRALRVRGLGGASNLNCQEVYFNTDGYMIHQHEFGVDRIIGNQVFAIRSFFETADISYVANGPVAGDGWQGDDRWIDIERLEPDFVQVGDMTVTVRGRRYAQSEITEVTFPMPQGTDKVDIKLQYREMRFRFESNTQGGDYKMGQPIVKLGVGDGHQ